MRRSGCYYYGKVVMDLANRLTALGFTAHEARVYLALLSQPYANGYEIAKDSALPRGNVYQVLSSLLAKQAIQQVSVDPARYVAVAPADVLGRIKRETAERCDTLIGDLATLTPPSEPTAFWTLRGRDAVVERAIQLIGGAARRVAVCLWADDLLWARDALRDAASRDCRVVVNVFGKAELDFGEVYRHEDPAKIVTGHLLTLATDSSDAMVAALDEPSAAVYTRHPVLVRLVEKLIRDETYLAAIYEAFQTELTATFGPHLVELRRKLLPADEAERLVSVVGFGAPTVAAHAALEGIWEP
jgi:sugar-specific transcriptional regulator TrmB